MAEQIADSDERAMALTAVVKSPALPLRRASPKLSR
jgi:hypothetical protein